MRTISAVGPGDSFHHWHHVTCRQFSITECRRVVEQGFSSRISVGEVGDLGLYDYYSSTPADQLIEVTRRQPDIRRDQRENFQLWYLLAGEASLAQCDRLARMEAGDIAVQDQSQPFDLVLGEISHAFLVTIPRHLLSSRISADRDLAARHINGASKLGGLVGSFVRQLSSLDQTTDPRVEAQLAASTLDILAAALDAGRADQGEQQRRDRQLDEVKQYILDNLANTGLDIDTIARARNVAPRTLNRLFASEGTTPIRWLWQQRLAASHRALAEGRVRRVTDAAFEFGFKDVSHFSRSFKAAYGRSPGSLKRQN